MRQLIIPNQVDPVEVFGSSVFLEQQRVGAEAMIYIDASKLVLIYAYICIYTYIATYKYIKLYEACIAYNYA